MTGDASHPDRIQFGSCNSQHYEQILWHHMKERKPAAFVWGGDAVYADDFEYVDGSTIKKKVREATPAVFRKLYQNQLQHPGYRDFFTRSKNDRQPPPVVMGTFDDHDYGRNNGDRSYKYRRESAVAYMDFVEGSNPYYHTQSPWAVMKDRAKQGKGLYGVKVMDFLRPAGQQLLTDVEAGLDPTVVVPDGEQPKLSDRSVAIFLLDCRSNKTPWVEPEKNETPKIKSTLKYDGDYLGEEQWAWFEEAIGRSTAAVNIVVQGLQVHADRYFDGHLVENWSRFPMSQHRLYQAVLKPNVQAPILISGDVHMSSLMRRDCRRIGNSDQNSRLLLELTASGMTHSWGYSTVCATD